MTEVKRSVRVSARLRAELVAAFRDMRDPRLGGVVVTRVEMPDDLQSARVFVRVAGEEPGPEGRRRVLSGLAAASGRLRRDVGRALGLRYAPELKFAFDTGRDASDRIEEILRELAVDDKSD